MRLSGFTLSAVLLAGLGATSAHAIPVTTCGQVVKGTGDLVADLDCSGHLGRSVQLIGRLRLNGFTLTGNPASPVVYCNIGSCLVSGPGTLTGGSRGVTSDVGVTVVDATVTSNTGDGVFSFRSARIKGAAVITNNGGNGVRASRIVSVVGGKQALPDTVISGNGGDGIQAVRAARVQSGVVTGNAGDGIETEGAASLAASTVQTNGFDGVRGLSVRLRDTTATGNGTAPTCGVSDDCADLAAARKPAVNGASTCDVSRNTAGGTWGVCSLD